MMNIMSPSVLDFVFDKLFSSTKGKEMSLVKMNSMQNNLLGDWTSISSQVPADIHQLLIETGCISSLESFPDNKSVNTKYRRILNKNIAVPFASPINSPIISRFLKDCVRQFSNYPEIYLDSACYLTSELSNIFGEAPTKSNIKMPSNETKMCDTIVKKSSESDPLNCLSSNAVETSGDVSYTGDPGEIREKCIKNECKKNADKYNLELSIRKTKELQKRSKKRRRRQKKMQTKSPCLFFERPKATNVKKLDAESSVPLNSPSKHNSRCTIDLFHDMFSNSSSCDKNSNFSEFSSTDDSSSSLHILLPGMASLFISVDNISDEDSEWDELGCSDWIPTAEFGVSGLFMPNLTVSKCNSSRGWTSPCEDAKRSSEFAELEKMKELLLLVNQSWNEATKDVGHQPKVPSKVTFAEDMNLVEICPVEVCDRKGEWELCALERLRFKRRIDEIDKILSPCLRTEHREKVYQSLYSTGL